ncbi:hypothetical protein AVEN_23219-1 [Araneus ventricosus]|uniref:MATH domain-containing protein n=1 Tax=Araneus ventricosus TaxID=182803 RepID=A0A4Y2Q9Q0_ARAVE|nr:hypothetical protein AVEN_23219-1 [Araneus ventricosus]
MNNGRKEYRITWFIENYSYCWHDNGDKLESPEFTAEGLEGTVWYLSLYPRGNGDESRSKISLSLQRDKLDGGPEDISVKYELSFRTPDGSVLISRESEHTFRKGISYGWKEFAQMDEVLLHRKADFLPQDRFIIILCVIYGRVKRHCPFFNLGASFIR